MEDIASGESIAPVVAHVEEELKQGKGHVITQSQHMEAMIARI